MRRRRSRQWGVKAALVVLVILTLFPYLFMVIGSGKDKLQFAESYWLPAFPIHWENYAFAWDQVMPYMISTVIIAAGSLAGVIVLSSVGGFVLARFSFPGRRFFFVVVAALLTVPNICALIPLFVMMRDFDLLNTYWAVILPHISGGCVLGTILMKTFIEGIPQELFDAARVDGADGWRMFGSIMAPLSLPVIGTVALITTNSAWNDFFWPLLAISDDNLRPISVGLLFFNGQAGTDYGPMFAGYMISSLPLLILFTFLSKQFLAGVQGGVPGAH